MTDEIHLSDLRELLDALTYPIARSDVVADTAGVTVLYADGEEPLEALVARTPSDRFASADELEAELMGSAPVGAVGEPGQSEGDA